MKARVVIKVNRGEVLRQAEIGMPRDPAGTELVVPVPPHDKELAVHVMFGSADCGPLGDHYGPTEVSLRSAGE